MVPNSKIQDLPAIIREAEEVVKEIKEPQMKHIAFREVLRHFLENKEHLPPKGAEKKSHKLTGDKVTAQREKKEGPMKWVEELKEEDFFKEPKNTNDILEALKERGHHLKPSDLTWPLNECVKPRRKILRRKKMKLPGGGKEKWYYSNW